MPPKAFIDIATLPEDDRVRIVGEYAVAGQRVAFVVADDVIADRYTEKLMQRFPSIIITQRAKDEIGHVWLRAERKPS